MELLACCGCLGFFSRHVFTNMVPAPGQAQTNTASLAPHGMWEMSLWKMPAGISQTMPRTLSPQPRPAGDLGHKVSFPRLIKIDILRMNRHRGEEFVMSRKLGLGDRNLSQKILESHVSVFVYWRCCCGVPEADQPHKSAWG